MGGTTRWVEQPDGWNNQTDGLPAEWDYQTGGTARRVEYQTGELADGAY